MMMQRLERTGQPVDTMLTMFDAFQAALWTALPCIVDSFNAAAMTCVLQPTLQMEQTLPDNSKKLINMPLLLDVPVVFMGAGDFILTFEPVPGDEALVVFADRCIDSWWQLGGIKPQAELRMHDLSDGFAILGPRSQPRVIAGGVKPGVAQLRSLNGDQYFELAAGGVINIAAPGGINFIGDTTFAGSVSANGTIIDQTHTHSGVDSGPDNTGPVT